MSSATFARMARPRLRVDGTHLERVRRAPDLLAQVQAGRATARPPAGRTRGRPELRVRHRPPRPRRAPPADVTNWLQPALLLVLRGDLVEAAILGRRCSQRPRSGRHRRGTPSPPRPSSSCASPTGCRSSSAFPTAGTATRRTPPPPRRSPRCCSAPRRTGRNVVVCWARALLGGEDGGARDGAAARCRSTTGCGSTSTASTSTTSRASWPVRCARHRCLVDAGAELAGRATPRRVAPVDAASCAPVRHARRSARRLEGVGWRPVPCREPTQVDLVHGLLARLDTRPEQWREAVRARSGLSRTATTRLALGLARRSANAPLPQALAVLRCLGARDYVPYLRGTSGSRVLPAGSRRAPRLGARRPATALARRLPPQRDGSAERRAWRTRERVGRSLHHAHEARRRYVLRLAIGNARTAEADVRRAWDVLNREART